MKHSGYLFSREALFHPETLPVFDPANEFPAAFDSAARQPSLANAWWLASASHLAYYDESSIARILAATGLSLYRFFACAGAQGFLATGQDYAILAFRGTTPSAPVNLTDDLDAGRTCLDREMWVHRGFLHSLDNIWPEVNAALARLQDKGLRLWYTGYSLGAAMAQLAALRRKPYAVYVFGSPRVGNFGFAQALHDVPVYRYNRCGDLIAWLPPRYLGYRDAGREFFIGSTGQPVSNATTWLKLRDRLYGSFRFYRHRPWGTPGTLFFYPMAEHAIGNYTHALFDAITQSNGTAARREA